MEMKNMQLFADNPTVNVTTDSGLSAENKTFYDRALIEEAQPNLIHGQFGQKRPSRRTEASGSSSAGTPPCLRR